MANKTIPQLPAQITATDLDLLVIVDSGETTTSKITRADLLNGTNPFVFGTAVDSRIVSNLSPALATRANTTFFQDGFFSGNTVQITRTSNTITTNSLPHLVIGNSNSAGSTDKYGITIGGTNNNTGGTGSSGDLGNFVMGHGNKLSFTESRGNIVMGGFNSVSAAANFRFGNNGSVGASASISFGEQANIASGSNNFAMGSFNTITGGNNINAGGSSNILANGTNAAIIGGKSNNFSGGNDEGNGLFSTRNSTFVINGVLGSTMIGGSDHIFRNFDSAGDTRFSYSSFLGGFQNKMTDDAGTGNGKTAYGLILGGRDNLVKSSTESVRPTIINSDSSILSGTTGSTVIGGSSVLVEGKTNTHVIGLNTYTAQTDNIVVVPNLEIPNYASLDFADDTAAAAGGVVLGQVYHNNGALRIRIA